MTAVRFVQSAADQENISSDPGDKGTSALETAMVQDAVNVLVQAHEMTPGPETQDTGHDRVNNIKTVGVLNLNTKQSPPPSCA